MAPNYISSAVAARASFNLVMTFNDGVEDGINQIWDVTDGSAPNNIILPNILETVLVQPSDTAENVYTYAGSNYEMEETSGDEHPVFGSDLYEQTIRNGRHKRRTLAIDRVDFSDDKIGKYRAAFHEAGTAVVVAPYRWLVNTMASGKRNGKGSALESGIDGLPFYGTHYALPGDTSSKQWSNDLVRPLGGNATTFAEMWNTMVRYPGNDGKPCGVRPTHLAVGSLDLDAAIDWAYMDKPSGGAGGGNRYRGRVQVSFVPEWENGECLMLDARSALKRGWVMQEREKSRLIPLFTDPNNPQVIRDGYLSWVAEGRWEVGMGHPNRVCRLRRG